MHRSVGVPLTFGGAILVALTLACQKASILGDQGPPDGVDPARVADKCRRMNFDTTRASTVLDLKNDSTVLVKIVPARKSIQTKLKDLGSRKGRVIGIAVNTGTAPWPLMAVAANDTSCWHVWLDAEEVVHAQWVSIKGDASQPDDAFDIKFHPGKHARDSAQWNPPEVAHLPAEASLFHLAGMEPTQLVRTGNVGWTTCLINGCCRSRQ